MKLPCTIIIHLKNEGQKGKTSPVWWRVPVGKRGRDEEGEGG
jgi:hypothetical protein